ncbi:hypothetical protein [Vibrio comitans]|uniref:Lipoprotein n=1 Tax=Vibrio comitans NBRC 102076 TaxID=1219078 RepID=A0A4Y3IR58_9VIBR|nr:hypothetical protein [Vibrio comitans]GEA62029.1 hypothetical protein VCO01S_32220 [Vibrio comitans NBRC 102076]
MNKYNGLLLVSALVLGGCGGEDGGSVKAPKAELKSDEINFKVFNLVYQGTALNNPSYQALSFEMSFENPITGTQNNKTTLTNYMFASRGVMTIPDSEENALDLIDYKLSIQDSKSMLGSGSFPIQFEDGKSQPLIFASGDLTQTPSSIQVSMVEHPKSLSKANGTFPVFFMNTTNKDVKLELFYSDVIYPDATQVNVKSQALSDQLDIQSSELEADVRVTDSQGNTINCSVGAEHADTMTDRENKSWLLVLVPLLSKSQTKLTCQHYPL